jgi:hypothetical protein
MSEELRLLINIAAVIMVFSLAMALLLLAVAIRQVKKIRVPPSAGFVATLQGTPFVVVLGLDLLDLALDVLAAPLAWVILEYLGLKGLQTVTVIESLFPGTQLIPTLTLCWAAARLMPDQLAQLLRDAEARAPRDPRV